MTSVDSALANCFIASNREAWTCHVCDNMKIRQISLVLSTHRDESRGFLLVMHNFHPVFLKARRFAPSWQCVVLSWVSVIKWIH